MKQRYKYFEKITILCLFYKMKQMHNTYVSTMFKLFMINGTAKYNNSVTKENFLNSSKFFMGKKIE